ncbi:hypothetical protein ACP70R_003299 [Stipagrostis hirtigluma subsp. patula]
MARAGLLHFAVAFDGRRVPQRGRSQHRRAMGLPLPLGWTGDSGSCHGTIPHGSWKFGYRGSGGENRGGGGDSGGDSGGGGGGNGRAFGFDIGGPNDGYHR